MRWFLTRVLVPGAIVLVAFVCAGLLIFSRPAADRQPPAPKVARVEVLQVEARDAVARIEATGAVQPSREVVITPEVSGRIVWQSDGLIPGGRVEKGEVLARVDARDYALRVEQAAAQVQQAELELELERGRQKVASREWELLGDGRAAEDSPLALRKPQLATAEQGVASARASLDQAKLALERTSLRAPFNALVLDEGIDPGQVVSPGTRVATLVGSDVFRVKVSIPVEKLTAVQLPGGAAPASTATVTQRLGAEGRIERTARVVQLLAELDPQTRTAQLLLEVDEPLGAPGELPLLPGAYVDVSLVGRELSSTLAVPRTALYDGDTLWVVVDDALQKRTVEVGWREAEDVIVLSGLESGARVVTSPLSLPIDGMPVEVVTATAAAANPRENL